MLAAALASAGDVRRSSRAKRSTSIITEAPGNHAPIGGVKVVDQSGWFAARPSGTEDIYKIYAESFRGADPLERILAEAQGDRRRGARVRASPACAPKK